ncbi:MAG TPA: GNAT family N-acetyltransferase [Actinomycetota bacterium]|nr:GNAT family N-acetyltransferase [Actinomycetota bacterium]
MAVVRRAEARDVPQLAPLMLEYIVDFYRQPRPSDGDLHALIDVLLKRDEGVQFVAEDDGRLTGFATLYFTWGTLVAAREAVMYDLYIVQEARGSGVARDLFEACVEESRRRGCKEMVWETAPDNHRAQRFYEKMGATRGPWVTYSIDAAGR